MEGRAEGGGASTADEGPHSVSVVVCAYTDRRWELLRAAIRSLRDQSRPPDEVLLVIDHDEALLQRAQRSFPEVEVLANLEEPGLSGARNTGVAKSSGTVVAFLDDDARASRDWLERMLSHYSDPGVLGVGGGVRADWLTGRPAWYPPEFEWVVGCSYRGQPTSVAEVRNPIGAGMSFRRSVFAEVGGFDVHIGRIGTLPLGCEETELSIRARRRWPSGKILLDPRATVQHAVPGSRATLHYLVSRCWSEGISKSVVAGVAGTEAALGAERGYVGRVLTTGVLRELTAFRGRRGDLHHLASAGAICLGLCTAVAGYTRASLDRRFQVPTT